MGTALITWSFMSLIQAGFTSVCHRLPVQGSIPGLRELFEVSW